MTDNRALWELVDADREFDEAEKERAALVDDGPKLDQCSTEHFDKVMAACERKGRANIRRREALAAIALLERPVVVGDEDVERAIKARDAVLFAGNWEPKDYTDVLLKSAMRAALESMVRGSRD